MSRQSVAKAGKIFCHDKAFSGHDRVDQNKEKLCCDGAILCRDGVGLGRHNFCRDRGFLGRDRASHD